jgi:hypothetical protein
MRQYFTVKFFWAAIWLSAIVGAQGSPAFAAQQAFEVASGVCHHQAGKILSLKGPLRVTVSRDGATAGSGGKTARAGAGPCAAPSEGGIVMRGVSNQPVVKEGLKKR